MPENKADKKQIFCVIRRKYVALTPEEHVRQNILNYFINKCSYPQALISVEAQIKVGKLLKRYDIVVYTYQWQPWLLVECKQPAVELTQEILNQILSYNHTLKAPYLLITNGINYFCFSVKDNKRLNTLPKYPS
ncbi:MAG: type I restriction enzyme HsdR N-terminal domain-containing protein [Bacteroidales bacterium]|jgi:hypothetical protein|nr:type I restriction enzyme HsdR N-terminal domain-containing protein [Bacteroidales bacterium]